MNINLEKLYLINSARLKKENFGTMVEEYAAAGIPFLGMTSKNDYKGFLHMCTLHSVGVDLPKGHSPYTRYFLVDNSGKIYAQGDIRHTINAYTLEYAGQLGYGVLPSCRNMGIGKLMCKLLLQKIAEEGFNEIIVTCEDTNIASAKIIESNGGILQEIHSVYDTDVNLRYYKIIINK